MAARTPPTLEDACRAGAGRVLGFGSVARGDATPRSDIDLVAIHASLDDLGCSVCRGRLEGTLSWDALQASRYRVDVLAADAPTWAARQRLRCTLETAIAPATVKLFDRLDPAQIDWDKPTERPLTVLGEVQDRCEALCSALVLWRSTTAPRPDAPLPGDRGTQARTMRA